MGRLEQKVALITGGTNGIGLGCVKRFVEEGANVVIADIEDDKGRGLTETLGDSVRYCHADVSREDDVIAAVDLAVNTWGRLDTMFNNAGFGGVGGEIHEIDLGEEYDYTMAAMFKGVLMGMKHAARVMRPQKAGSILSTASVAGIQGGMGGHVYSAIKAGVIGMTRSVALELAACNIRVNAICPGGIATRIFAGGLDTMPDSNQSSADFARGFLSQIQPIPRSGEPEDIAGMAVFLASDDAAFVTGQAMVVDGGLTSTGGLIANLRQEILEKYPELFPDGV